MNIWEKLNVKSEVLGVFLLLVAVGMILAGLSLSWRLIVELFGLLIFIAGVGLLLFSIRVLKWRWAWLLISRG